MLKHEDLENNMRIDKDQAFPVVAAETGLPAQISGEPGAALDGQQHRSIYVQ
jgi:L,D-transpeptidase ErfK/SrfK